MTNCMCAALVVYHVTIVAIGHWLLKKFWPLVLSCVLRTALLKLCRPAYFVRTTVCPGSSDPT